MSTMVFRMHVELENDAMRTHGALAKVLQRLPTVIMEKAQARDTDGFDDEYKGVIRDDNGNKVGSWRIGEE